MKLISDIINELIDLQKPLEGALLKTKVLASRINNTELLEWVNGELNGFTDIDNLPDYRKSSGEIIGTYINGSWKYSAQPISLSHLDKSIISTIKEINVVDSISSLSRFIDKGLKNLTFSINAETQRLIEFSIKKIGNPFFQILEVHRMTTPLLLSNIISIVRSKLLEFMLAIESEFGTETEIKILKERNPTITTIMKTTINNHGDANIINTGNDVSIKSEVTLYKGDQHHLAETLKKNHVESDDIQELIDVVDTYPALHANQYSAPVSKWIQKMMNKAIDGSWQVGIGAAGGILADALATHYGWK
ncbi:hypothetical protein [Mucilaginibacter sp. FT3.2]|uniref:AbiTii domain-containing protein n=1 Tax=Mucilaginibacter sp. FT3.2 TaxID=2723090 RepID=UPI0016128B78|nr:hypothetical protein [Mucilaginibacter sp. FT3.2]MBB6229902.1 hypothetical protein [Mucilaginibacter sp. FT3.2]